MYQVIASSSSGNAYVAFGEILIDVGVRLEQLTPYLKDIKIIVLTHEHGDHMNHESIARIALLRPEIKWICGNFLFDKLKRLNVNTKNIIVKDIDDEWLKVDKYLFYPIDLYHGDRRGRVSNYGWRIVDTSSNYRLAHMTDTGSYEGIDVTDCDLVACEANHHKQVIEKNKATKKARGGYTYEVLSSVFHSSIEHVEEWLAENSKPNAKIIYLHGSGNNLDWENLTDIQKERFYYRENI